MTAPYPEPTSPRATGRDYYGDLLDFERETTLAKVGGLPASVQGTALPSGWTPLGLLKHLAFVEMRWLEWGFEGAEVESPFADRVDGVFVATPAETFAVLAVALRRRGEATRRIIAAHDLGEVGRPSDRWDGEPPPTLERVLQHLAYEYARHLGHLDIVVELATGSVGE